MIPQKHIFWGFIFSLFLGLAFPDSVGILGAVIIFISSVLIDIDHYIYYIYKTKNWNLKKSVLWYFKNRDKFSKMTKQQKNKIYTGLCFLHGIEAIILVILLILIPNPFSNIMIFILIGFIFHQILDAIDLYIRDYRFDKVISFFYSLHHTKNKTLLQEMK